MPNRRTRVPPTRKVPSSSTMASPSTKRPPDCAMAIGCGPAARARPSMAEARLVLVDREPLAERRDAALDRSYRRFMVRAAFGEAVEYVADEVPDFLELADAEPARGPGRRAETDARGDGGPLRVERHAVLVAGDPRTLERLLGLVALHPLGAEIDQHQVVVGAAGNDGAAALLHHVGQRLGVG